MGTSPSALGLQSGGCQRQERWSRLTPKLWDALTGGGSGRLPVFALETAERRQVRGKEGKSEGESGRDGGQESAPNGSGEKTGSQERV